MKSWRLVSGILSIVLAVATSFSACFNGTLLIDYGTVFFGNIVSLLMLGGGIVSICVREGSQNGNIALLVLFGIATVLGIFFAPGVFLYAIWCLVCTITAIIGLVKGI